VIKLVSTAGVSRQTAGNESEREGRRGARGGVNSEWKASSAAKVMGGWHGSAGDADRDAGRLSSCEQRGFGETWAGQGERNGARPYLADGKRRWPQWDGARRFEQPVRGQPAAARQSFLLRCGRIVARWTLAPEEAGDGRVESPCVSFRGRLRACESLLVLPCRARGQRPPANRQPSPAQQMRHGPWLSPAHQPFSIPLHQSPRPPIASLQTPQPWT